MLIGIPHSSDVTEFIEVLTPVRLTNKLISEAINVLRDTHF